MNEYIGSDQDVCVFLGELQEKGWQLKHIVLVHLYVWDMADFGKVNEIYHGFFGRCPPAR